nr:hypothetical protein [uncultured Cellulosilyticum sp.]
MINFTDIVKSVIDVLKSNFNLPVYANEVKEGYKEPCFFVRIYPVSSDVETKNYMSTDLRIEVSYYSDTDDTVENMMVVQTMRKVFGVTLKVGDRTLTIHDTEVEGIDDDIYEFTFSTSYLELVNFDTEPEVATTLHIRKVEN